MSRDREYLLDILESAKIAAAHAASKSKEDFLNDLQCQDAVIRRLEIIGEASKRISYETKDAFPKVPWKTMAATRNILIHEYDDLDMEIIWETIQKDLPELISIVEETITEMA